MAKEVRIQLTATQKAKIKAATGKVMSEIRVSSIGKNLAVAPGQKTTRLDNANAPRLSGDVTTRLDGDNATRAGVDSE